MDILFFIFLLIGCQGEFFYFSTDIDHCLKRAKQKVRKAPKLMYRDPDRYPDKISVGAYWVQIFNRVFVILYSIISVIGVFVYRHIVLHRISFWLIIVYMALMWIIGFVIANINNFVVKDDELDKEEIIRYVKRRKLRRARRLEITETDVLFGENVDLEQIKEFETKILNRVLNMPTIKSLDTEVSQKNWTYEIEIDRDTDLFSRYFSSVKISFFDSKKRDNADNGNIFELTFFDTITFVKKKQTFGLDITVKKSFICSLEKHINRIRRYK